MSQEYKKKYKYRQNKKDQFNFAWKRQWSCWNHKLATKNINDATKNIINCSILQSQWDLPLLLLLKKTKIFQKEQIKFRNLKYFYELS